MIDDQQQWKISRPQKPQTIQQACARTHASVATNRVPCILRALEGQIWPRIHDHAWCCHLRRDTAVWGLSMRKHCEYGSLLYKEGRVKVSFSRRIAQLRLQMLRSLTNATMQCKRRFRSPTTPMALIQQSTEVQTRTASIDTEASTVAVSDDIDIVSGGDDVPIPMEDIDEPPGETMDLTINEELWKALRLRTVAQARLGRTHQSQTHQRLGNTKAYLAIRSLTLQHR